MTLDVLVLLSGYVITRDSQTGMIIQNLSGEVITVFKLLSDLEGRTISGLGYIQKVNYKLLLESDQYFEKMQIGSDFSNFIKIIAANNSTDDLALELITKLQCCDKLPNEVSDILIDFMQKHNMLSCDKTF